MTLDSIVIIQGIYSTIFVFITLIIGLKIALKYVEYKNINLILVGVAWIGLSEPWWSSTISFLVALVNQKGLSIELYFIIGNTFIPLFVIFWLIAMTNILKIRLRGYIISCYIVIAGIFESLFFYYLFIDISKLGVLLNPVDINYTTIVVIFLILNLLIVCVSGIIFAINSLKSKDKEILIKGKLLLVAFLTFLIGAAIDTIITIPPSRLILVFSSVCFYIGYVLPNWIKKKLLT